MYQCRYRYINVDIVFETKSNIDYFLSRPITNEIGKDEIKIYPSAGTGNIHLKLYRTVVNVVLDVSDGVAVVVRANWVADCTEVLSIIFVDRVAELWLRYQPYVTNVVPKMNLGFSRALQVAYWLSFIGL